MRFLVTGGAGFIGSHIIERLLTNGNEVICLDNFDHYYDPVLKRANIEKFIGERRFRLIEGDINDRALLSHVLKGVEYIFHEAAQPGVQASVENPSKPHSINATGTLTLLEMALKSDVKKIINASSSSVYGKVAYLPFDEEHPKEPLSPYGISKLSAEGYCRVFHELYGLQSVSLRYFTVYGPRMRPDLAINIFVRLALKNEPITIYGTGNKTRDFTYIDDIVNANMISVKKGKGAYNIGGGHRISIQELAEKIIEITKSSSSIQHKESNKGDAEHTYAQITKARREIGWEPKVSLEQGLKRYVEWVSTYQ